MGGQNNLDIQSRVKLLTQEKEAYRRCSCALELRNCQSAHPVGRRHGELTSKFMTRLSEGALVLAGKVSPRG